MHDETRAEYREITVPRTARYAVLGAGVSAPEEIWLVCHGYGQLASRFIRRFGVIDNGKRLIVAPEALSRFYLAGGFGPHSAGEKVGASWMTREGRDSEIADQVRYLDMVRKHVLDGVSRARVRLVGFGFSQGAATICRWAARTPTPPDHVILWGSGVPAELLEGEAREGLARTALTLVAGKVDPVVHGEWAGQQRAQLDAAGVRYRFMPYDGGHEVDRTVLARVAMEVGGERSIPDSAEG